MTSAHKPSRITARLPNQTAMPFLIHLASIPLIPATIGALWHGSLSAGLSGIIGCVLLFFAAYIIGRGIRYEKLARERRWHRRKSMPWKAIGAALIGWSVFLIAKFMVGTALFNALLLGCIATFGVVLRYGLDTRFVQPDTVNRYGITIDEIVALTDEAREKIYALEQATNQIRTPSLSTKLRTIANKAKRIVDELENDPRELRKARKFLKVYLEGAMSVTAGYAEQGQAANNASLDANFDRVLDTIDTTFDEQYKKLQQHDVLNLDVQIEVLEKQMQHEGIG